MPSISLIGVKIGLVLFVLGVASLGAGFVSGSLDACESGYAVTVDRLSENETAAPEFERVAYGELSTVERRAFDRIRSAETPPLFEHSDSLDGLARRVVTYRGARYEVGGLVVSDCVPAGAAFFVFGTPATALGGVVAGLAGGWWYVRARTAG